MDSYMNDVSFNDLLSESKMTGPARSLLSTLPQFVKLLAKSGLRGPVHFTGLCLDRRGRMIGRGAQFTVFEDKTQVMGKVVIKRVNAELVDADKTSLVLDDRRKGHLRTLELEIRALCHKPIREHPNIVTVSMWGFDYPTRDSKLGLPLLIMERAVCSLHDLLHDEGYHRFQMVSQGVRHQLSSDVLAGLICLHEAEIIHGDLKPANVLIFERQLDSSVPFVAKLNDFGMCIPLEEQSRVSYRSYGGTPGWLAPELCGQANGSQEPSDKNLLFKCDIFSFGLLVLSLFLSSGEALFGSDLNSIGWCQEALRLIESMEFSSKISSPMAKLLNKVALDTLDKEPKNRARLDQSLLADESTEYVSW